MSHWMDNFFIIFRFFVFNWRHSVVLSPNLMLVIIMLRIWRQATSFWHWLFVQFEGRAAIFSVRKIEPISAPSRHRPRAICATVSRGTARGHVVVVLTPAVIGGGGWGLFPGWAVTPIPVCITVVGVVVPVERWTLAWIFVIGPAVGCWRGWAVVWNVAERAGRIFCNRLRKVKVDSRLKILQSQLDFKKLSWLWMS